MYFADGARSHAEKAHESCVTVLIEITITALARTKPIILTELAYFTFLNCPN